MFFVIAGIPHIGFMIRKWSIWVPYEIHGSKTYSRLSMVKRNPVSNMYKTPTTHCKIPSSENRKASAQIVRLWKDCSEHHYYPPNFDISNTRSLWPLVFVLNNTLILGIWRSTIPHLLGCFCPWTFFVNIGFNTVLTDPFMSHPATQLGYSAGEFQALQLIALAAFGVLD